ncbi:glycosyltransferase [Candidatus Pelagibacter sp. HIMB1495]|uniref:glycosyltransferase n=1 Tax=unclassified Candidatus Pelagibacter TaxID=2647897 RepID=UPI003F829FD3
MKVLYISKSIIPSRTANSIHVMKMCQALSDNGHDVVLLAPGQKKLYENGVRDVYDYYGVKKNFLIKKIWHPDLKGGVVLYLIGILYYLIFNNKFHLVYGRFLHGCYVATLLKNEVIFESHENFSTMKKHRLIIFKKLIKSKYLKKLIVISQALKNIYLQSGFLNTKKIYVAHDGADEVLNLNSKIKLKGDEKNLKVGYVGHLYRGRGIELIIQCAKQMKDVTFHIVGGTYEDINKWKNYSNKLKLSNIFFYGFVPPNETINYRNSFDILLALYGKQVSVFGFKDTGNTSEFMSPLKIFEYMAHKKAIIASNLPVLREVLTSKNSILVKPEDLDDLVKSITVLKKKELRDKLGANALKDFKKFSWKHRVENIMNNL